LSLTVAAFVVTAVPAFLLTKVIGKNLESIYVMGAALLIGGVAMWVVDAIYGKPRASTGYKTNDMEEMTLGQAIWIGACQITSAVFPGTSRSMSTIAGGQLTGMSRPAALEFSFFLSMPTMIAATAYDLLKSLRHHGLETGIGIAPANAHEWAVLAIGFVISFIVAYAVVAWFMHWVRKRGFAPFAVYRIIVGIAVLAWAMSAAS
jgi:undecaprenyl-diphosphatase